MVAILKKLQSNLIIKTKNWKHFKQKKHQWSVRWVLHAMVKNSATQMLHCLLILLCFYLLFWVGFTNEGLCGNP